VQQRGRVLHRQPAGDVAHRRQQGQAPGAILDGFERHGREADPAEAARELGQRGQVQVTEQQVILAKPGEIGLYRLLDLHDHLGFGEQLVRSGQYRDAHVAKMLIRVAALLAGRSARRILRVRRAPVRHRRRESDQRAPRGASIHGECRCAWMNLSPAHLAAASAFLNMCPLRRRAARLPVAWQSNKHMKNWELEVAPGAQTNWLRRHMNGRKYT
jgi:hypothetical protein